ncbi:carboxylesterase/lipase family protein [Sapientia aquatica]|uniref:Carboxylic ester hydrolase n=1 Tax=Sapientia aquatica TaxID=1549640 RepID=A0A4R5VPT2_9BURK|nr:carboxylesterase family protein [Sapientia aquatica]TDK60459.1 carboxylesterase [Sapientia aquatica]
MKKRLTYALLSLGMMASLDWPCSASAGEPAPTVAIEHSLIQGTAAASHPGMGVFRGIPFAKPPVGPMRWAPPEPTMPGKTIIHADHFAPACYQGKSNTDWYRAIAKAFDASDIGFTEPQISEDCLYLNIWVPSLQKGEKLPVMVWIHGGGNRDGYSFEPNYQGANLAAEGRVIVVSVAYRLNVFGFLRPPGLDQKDPSATFALLDQIAALKWIQKNISGFGGDRKNVTLFGESAGASNIGYLLSSPVAAPLFRRAISQSGGFQMFDHYSAHTANDDSHQFFAPLSGDLAIKALREIPAATLLDHAGESASTGLFRPVVDGTVISQFTAARYREHGIRHDLLIGSNEDEWYMYLDPTEASFENDIASMPPESRQALRSIAARESDIRHGHDKAYTFANMVCPAYLMARAVNSAHHAWVYHFTKVRNGDGGLALGSYHGAEIPYVFDTHDAWLPTDASDIKLTREMIAYWTNFARTGNPNGGDLIAWPRFDTRAGNIMQLGVTSGSMVAPNLETCLTLARPLYESDKDLGAE